MTTISDNQAYQSGSYTAYVAPFDVGSLVYGKGYTETMSINAAEFPNSVTAAWKFPINNVANIRSFIAVDYGDYDYTTPINPITPSTIASLTTLNETIKFTESGNLQGFDIITDMFLTSAPKNNNTDVAEVEIFLHSPTYSQQWAASLTSLGTVTVSGVTWNVSESGADGNSQGTVDYVFMPANDKDFSSGTINIESMLQFLVTNGGLSGAAYFNGLATGVETDSGSGSWDLIKDSVDPETSSPVTGSNVNPLTVVGLSALAPELTVAGGGGTVPLGVTVTAPTSGASVGVTVTGLPSYETITDVLDDKTFSGSSVTLTEAEVNSGLTLTSTYAGKGHPVSTLTFTASDGTTTATQTITVTDPPPSTSSAPNAAAALIQHMASGFGNGAGDRPLTSSWTANSTQHAEPFLTAPHH